MENSEYKLPRDSVIALGHNLGIIPNKLTFYQKFPEGGDTQGIIVNESLREMLETLFNPKNVAVVTMMQRDESLVKTSVCTGKINSVYVGMGKGDVMFKVMETKQFAEGFVTFFDNGAILKKQGRSLEMSRDGVLALMALVDLFTFNKMMSLLEHTPKPSPLTIQGMKGIVVGAVNKPDPRWLMTNMLTYGNIGELFDIDAGLNELYEKRILEKTDDGVLHLGEKKDLISGLAEPEIFCDLKSYAFNEGKLIPMSLILFRTRDFLWALDLTGDRSKLNELDFLGAADYLFDVINRGDYSDGPIPDEEIPMASQPSDLQKEQPIFCSHCGNTLEANDQFCNKCGEPVHDHHQVIKDSRKTQSELAVHHCVHCGTTLKQGTRFCTKCGVAVQPTADKKICPFCKTMANAEAKFCLKCGKPI